MSRPLLIRPNSRYTCHGDGTCCTTIHLLGPLKKREARFVDSKAAIVLPDNKGPATYYHDGIEEYVFATHQHRCVFQDSEGQCRFHKELGEACKPAVCRHFPVGATKTPHGTRVTLSHRCPCVSIGDGALVDEPRARSIIASPKTGRIVPDITVSKRVMRRKDREVRFDDYVTWEATLLEQLDGPDPQPRLSDVLGMGSSSQLPPLRKKSWNEISKRMLAWVQDESEEDGFFCAVRWAALELRDAPHPWTPLLRPWGWTLRRAASGESRPHSPHLRVLACGLFLVDGVVC